MTKAYNAGDWDLCKELSRFLTSFDSKSRKDHLLIVDTGHTLRRALAHVGLSPQSSTDGVVSRRSFILMTEHTESPTTPTANANNLDS